MSLNPDSAGEAVLNLGGSAGRHAMRSVKVISGWMALVMPLAMSGCISPPEQPPRYPSRNLLMDYSISKGKWGERIESCGRLTPSGVPYFGWQVRAYPDGSRHEEHFSNSLLNGPRLNRYNDGAYRIVFYRNGKEHGRREYWYANGRRWQEAVMKNNKMDGPGREWYPSGKLKSVFRFKNDKLVESAKWDEKGNLLKRESL